MDLFFAASFLSSLIDMASFSHRRVCIFLLFSSMFKCQNGFQKIYFKNFHSSFGPVRLHVMPKVFLTVYDYCKVT